MQGDLQRLEIKLGELRHLVKNIIFVAFDIDFDEYRVVADHALQIPDRQPPYCHRSQRIALYNRRFGSPELFYRSKLDGRLVGKRGLNHLDVTGIPGPDFA